MKRSELRYTERKARLLLVFALVLQAALFLFLLLRGPAVGAQLETAQDEVSGGRPDLLALTVRNPDGTETTVSFDPDKSASENLLDRSKARLVVAERGHRSIMTVSLLVSFHTAFVLILLLVFGSRRPNHAL